MLIKYKALFVRDFPATGIQTRELLAMTVHCFSIRCKMTQHRGCCSAPCLPMYIITKQLFFPLLRDAWVKIVKGVRYRTAITEFNDESVTPTFPHTCILFYLFAHFLMFLSLWMVPFCLIFTHTFFTNRKAQFIVWFVNVHGKSVVYFNLLIYWQVLKRDAFLRLRRN